MDLEGFEKISTNCELMLHIYKLLNFKDQLSLARSCAPLEMIFQEFIRKNKYRSLKICGNSRGYIVTDDTNINRLSFPSDLLQDFLEMYAENVEELDVSPHVEINLRQFKNLTTLTYYCIEKPLEKLRQIAKTAPRLESLHLYLSVVCRTTSIMLGQCKPMDITRFCNIETLLEMKNLKRLYLESWNTVIKYQNFQELVNKLKLEVLKLDSIVLREEEPEKYEELPAEILANPVQLRELDIETTFLSQRWSYNLTTFEKLFENLTILTVKIRNPASEDTLSRIAVCCKNLQVLNIHHTTFAGVETFSLPPNVTALSLNHCKGLTSQNLKHLLTETTITKFTSIETYTEGLLDDFRISPLIQTLDSDCVELCRFSSRTNSENTTLKHLTLNLSKLCSITKLKVISPVPLLASFAKLESLRMVRCQIGLNVAPQLRSLRKLEIPLINTPINWNYFGLILMLPSLKELIINEFISDSGAPKMIKSYPTKICPTTVTSLKIHYDAFAMSPNYWMQLFHCNPKMVLTIMDVDRENMQEMRNMNYKLIRRHLKAIDFFGFNLSCEDLARDYDVTVAVLENDTYHPLIRNETEDMRRIIFSRK